MEKKVKDQKQKRSLDSYFQRTGRAKANKAGLFSPLSSVHVHTPFLGVQ